MDSADLDYELPEEFIAQTPMEPRDAARLLVPSADAATAHRHVRDLPDLLDPGDLLVVNDSRVIPARLHLRKPTGGAVEVLVLERHPDGRWEALVRPGKRVAAGTVLTTAGTSGDPIEVTVGETIGSDGRRLVSIDGRDLEDLAVLDQQGEMPLPPYIHEPLTDTERYQTVYANRPGSVAAPTAGLHLTPEVLDRCRDRGIAVATVDLVVGLGTFRPIQTERVEDHPMHAERYCIPAATVAAIEACDGSVVAVGTTVVRTLESWAATGETQAATSLFIHGDHRFAVVDRLMTNFHVPRSSLLALVQAFGGPHWRDWYGEAQAERYRFLSFGDAMLLDRREPRSAPRRPDPT